MKIIDISRSLQSAPLYPDTIPPKVTKISQISKGNSYNLSMITADSHTGTHADAFSHYLGEDALTIDKMPLDRYYGKCKVISFPKNTLITKDMLINRIEGTERVVLKTGGNSFLVEDGARYLAECNVKTIVTDGISIAPIDNETQIHKIILSAGIAVVENVILEDVAEGEYILSAFPMKIEGCDGGFVRAVLIDG